MKANLPPAVMAVFNSTEFVMKIQGEFPEEKLVSNNGGSLTGASSQRRNW
jgi:hypothetical protein